MINQILFELLLLIINELKNDRGITPVKVM